MLSNILIKLSCGDDVVASKYFTIEEVFCGEAMKWVKSKQTNQVYWVSFVAKEVKHAAIHELNL